MFFDLKDTYSYFENNRSKVSSPHRSDSFQILWFIKEGRHFVDYQTINHDPSTVFFISKNQTHYYCLDAFNEGFIFSFDEEFIGSKMNSFILSLFNQIGSGYLKVPKEKVFELNTLSNFIETELSEKRKNYKEKVYHYFINVLLILDRLISKEDIVLSEKRNELKLTLAFKELVFKEMSRSHNISFYSETLGTNSKTLTESTKNILNQTPAEVIKEVKILEAKRKLTTKEASIAEVAYDLGFEDPTYFTKYFKKSTGYTPKAFQKLDFQKEFL